MSAWTFRAGYSMGRGVVIAERKTGEVVRFAACLFPAGWRVSPVHEECPRSVYAEARRIARGWW